jgi:hypothetical protein
MSRYYVARFGAPLFFVADDDDQARLILNHIAEHILDAPLPHGATWTAVDDAELFESVERDQPLRPVATDRETRYAPVSSSAARDCPACADHARRQNYPREDAS